MDDILREDGESELEGELPVDEELGIKKKNLLDEDVESVEDLAEDELALDKEDLMDDVEEM